MKKLKLLLMLIVFLLGLNYVKAFDTNEKIYDYAQVLTQDEENNLKSEAEEFIRKYNMDIVMVTVKHHDKYSTKEYAMDFYDYNGFGVNSTNDGIIFVIDFTFGKTDFWITTTGEAIRMYDDYRIDCILDDIDEEYYNDNENYYKMFSAYIKSASYYANLGIPSSNKNTYIDENGDIHYKKSIPWHIILLISLGAPSIVVAILIFKNRMVRKSVNAAYYVKEGSVNITARNDRFLTTHTTSVRINTDSGGSGGSSISRGSSGVSHGGGGRSH